MLPDDFDLTNAHLQALSSREAIVAFLAQLGYNTEARLRQTSAALGFSDVLVHEVTHVERVADHENGELQVYLLEMKHVTVALTQALARSLRNRAGNFLLVLTADYERIDFVLMELVRPEGSAQGIKPASAFLRPRTLTLERRNPSLVDVRVLRRFSYTESDVYYQLDKIRSAYGVAEWSEPFFNNRALFSDYYLNERLPQLPEWQADAAPSFRALSKLLADAREKFAGKREAELRTLLYQPLFAALGWKAEAQKAGHEADARADYVLNDASGARVPCLTYVWDRYLDGPDETRDSETPRENPAQTVVGLLDHDQAGGWAIVTNGKVWRLYSARAHSRATNYYEIDLEETLASPDVDVAFRYFWLFFKPHPPAPSPEMKKHISGEGESEGVRFLDFLLDESASFAKALGERLKDRVFGEVFPYFAEGFIKHGHGAASSFDSATLRSGRAASAHPSTALRSAQDAWTDDDLVVAFQATLTFLYRLLFVLYAEARDLLPVRETRGYWEVSLQRIKEEIAAKAGNLEDEAADRLEKAYSAGETTLYDRLLKLFRAIDRGAAELNVPIYNGGLFQTELSGAEDQSGLEITRFLQSHKIPDRYLALGLDRMARDIDARRGDLVAIDYKSLGVRHLGSIYEGLLEFRLRIAREKMAVVRGKKTDEVVPAREAGDAKIKATLPRGAVYLENDKHERKATGSYYTPDYIVKYIVQHTVGPVLDEKFEALRPRLRQAAKRFDETVTRKQTIEHTAPDRPALLNDLAGDLLRDLFDVKVLDPAMGSGHFLVEAVDFITDRLLRFLYGFPFVNHFFEGQRGLILSALQRQGVTVDPARLTDVNLLKRHVLKRCIFGVDLNPMAVELAKVSVWLDCFTLGAPLSFLDHHLKWGNSLIGARVDEVRDAVEFKHAEQLSMFASSQFTGIMLATDLMRRVGELPDTTAEQVAASRAEFRRANDALAPYRRIMDVYVSKWFGNDLTGPSPKRRGERVDPTIEFLRRDETKAWLNDPKQGVKKLDAALKAVAETAQQAADDKRFLHWELEFPEVFFGPAQGSTQAIGLKEDGGFDAVIGNPPYVEQEKIVDLKPYFGANSNVFHGVADLYIYFYEQGLRLLYSSGRMAYISSGTFAHANFATNFRQVLPTIAQIETLIDFGENQPFPGAEMVHPSIMVLKKGAQTKALRSLFISGEIPASLEQALVEEGNQIEPEGLQRAEWALLSAGNSGLIDKLMAAGRPLLEVMDGKIYYGIKTGLNEAFMIDHERRSYLIESDPACSAMIKPLVRGEDLRPWYQEDEGRWLIVIPSGSTAEIFGDGLSEATAWKKFRERFPSLAEHLHPYADAARKRTDQGEYWWELRSCNYYDAFDKSKVFWPDIAKLPRFSLDTSGRYINDKGCIIPLTDLYLLAILQSRVSWFVISQICLPLRLRAGLWQYQMKMQFISRLPIPSVPAGAQESTGAMVVTVTEKARERYELNQNAVRHILSGFGLPAKGLNRKLLQWWSLDFEAFGDEVRKVYKRDIPLAQRGNWAQWLTDQKRAHESLTAEIIRLETDLNAQVYTFFGLSENDIRVIEDSTKYPYGEV